MKVVNHANLSSEEINQLESELPEHQNLNALMKWALSHPEKVFILSVVVDVIVQDEFTHDLIVPYRDGLVLVYDATWLGGITAVAVWNYIPSADEILSKRLEKGWEPRPSRLKEGDKVVGHAACVLIDK